MRGDKRVIRNEESCAAAGKEEENMLTRLAIVYWLIYFKDTSHDADNKIDHYNIIERRSAVVADRENNSTS